MFWKNWSYWVRGGIIGILSWLIIAFLAYFLSTYLESGFLVWILFILVILALFPTIFIQGESVFTTGLDALNLPTALGYILIVIFWFVIGALIGFIIGRLKSKKEVLS